MREAENAAWEIKERVSCRAFAEFMGLKVSPSGFAVCPFHGDRDASLKIYEGGRGWCCYGCHRGGDVINMAKEWYGTSFAETLRAIDRDFDLKLFDERTEPRRADDTGAAHRIIAQARRKKAENAARAAEEKYLDCYGEWLRWKTLSEMLEPKRNGGELYAGFGIALKNAQALETKLSKLESRRNALCRELKKAATY